MKKATDIANDARPLSIPATLHYLCATYNIGGNVRLQKCVFTLIWPENNYLQRAKEKKTTKPASTIL